MLSKFRRGLEFDFVLSNILIPSFTLLLYCAGFFFLHRKYIPPGVNLFFVYRLGILLSLLIACTYLYLAGLIVRKKAVRKVFEYQHRLTAGKLRRSDLLLLLLPLTPILQYLLINHNILSLFEAIVILLFFFALFGTVIFSGPVLFSRLSSARILLILGVAFTFLIANMATLSRSFSWYTIGNFGVQLVVLVALFGVLVWISTLPNETMLHQLIVGFFLLNSAFYGVRAAFGSDTESVSPDSQSLSAHVSGSSREPALKPNIFLLVYDAYVPNETMLSHGIDNSAQESFLEASGFKIYPHTYSIAAQSISTMSRVLNASTDYMGVDRRAVSGDGQVQHLLKDLGYETNGLFLSSYYFWGIGSSYDDSIPDGKHVPAINLAAAILVGEFRFAFSLTDYPYGDYAAAKEKVIKQAANQQVFLYTHFPFPGHSQNSGACHVEAETAQFQERLSFANTEMEKDVETILDYNPDAIIVIAGDHGPYLTKNCYDTGDEYSIEQITRLDIQDRFGTFLAVRWPTGGYEKYDQIRVLQDIFPAIFAYMYQDPGILDVRVEPTVLENFRISGASVSDGIIIGGEDDGEPLFLSDD